MFKLLKSKQEKKDEQRPIQEEMTLDQWRTTMLQLHADESSNHHRMGQHYNYLVDRKLAEAAGYKNAQDYISKELQDLSQAALSMYGAVARHFSESIARRFGVTCLYLLLVYKNAVEMEVNYEEPGGTVIEVPGEDGEVTPKLFSACTVEEMRRALQHKRKPASTKPLPEEERALAYQYLDAVAGRMPKVNSLRAQLRNLKGKAVLDFKGIPLGQVEQLAEALLARSRPVPQVPEVEQAPDVS